MRPVVARSRWDPSCPGVFPVPSWNCDRGISSQSADPTAGPWTPLEDGSGPAWASSPGRVAVGAHVRRQVGTAVSAVWQCHLAVTAAPGRQGQSRPAPQFTSRWGTAPGTGGGHSPPAQPGLLTHHGGSKGNGHSYRPPRRAPPSPASRTESLCARVCPLQLPSLGTAQLPTEPGRCVPRVPPPTPWGSGAPGWLGKALLMRALKIEWDWDLNGTLWETWKHFLIPINESRCINDDCIAS